jgi:hypothetical protein
MGILFALFAIVFYAGMLFLIFGGMWKTFTKAGQPGWACLIPFYNYLVMCDVARVSRMQFWKAFVVGFIGVLISGMLMFVGQDIEGLIIFSAILQFALVVAIFIFMFPIYKGIALNFGQSEGFAWGLLFFNVIFFAILGFGAARYQGGSYLNDDLLDSGF